MNNICECPACEGRGIDTYIKMIEGAEMPCITCGGNGFVTEQNPFMFTMELDYPDSDLLIYTDAEDYDPGMTAAEEHREAFNEILQYWGNP